MRERLLKVGLAVRKGFFNLVHVFKKDKKLSKILYNVAFYIELASELANKPRKNGGNMFRHQMITFTILIQYHYLDIILLKASLIHDLFEDLPERIEEFKKSILKNDPIDAKAVIFLVEEVSILREETKVHFYSRIFTQQSWRARVLKLVDNISNMTHIAHYGDEKFTVRYIKTIEKTTILYSEKINKEMHEELITLIALKKDRISVWKNNSKK